jgi:hypothetical protein
LEVVWQFRNRHIGPQYGHTLCVTAAPRKRDWTPDVRGLIGSW